MLREQENNWPCYECNRRFVSSEQLQQHLNMHDDKLNSASRFVYFFLLKGSRTTHRWSFLSHLQLFSFLFSEAEAEVEEEEGSDLAAEGDQDALLNLYVWSLNWTAVVTRQQYGLTLFSHIIFQKFSSSSSHLTFFKIEELLELADKPLEEQNQAAQNGLKVVEMEPEVEAAAEGTDSQLLAPAADQEPESVTLTLSADLPAPLKEDPAQSSQSDPPLSTQDLRRAKRIRVRAKALLASLLDCFMSFFGSEILMF